MKQKKITETNEKNYYYYYYYYHFITNKQLNAQTDPQTPMGSEKGKIKSWGKRLNERATKPIPSNQIQWSKPWNSIPGRDSKCGWVIQMLFCQWRVRLEEWKFYWEATRATHRIRQSVERNLGLVWALWYNIITQIKKSTLKKLKYIYN